MKIKDVLLLALVTLICWQFTLPFVNSLNFPINKTYGIISRLVIDGRSPLTNYAIYLILFLAPSFVILCSLFLWRKSTKLSLYLRNYKPFFKTFNNNYVFASILFLAIVCWLLNIKHQPMIGTGGGFAKQGFDFGEVVGLGGTFLQNPGLFYTKAYLMIHGFGLDVLPGFIGLILGDGNRDIAISGLLVDAHYTVATFTAFLVMLEIAAYISRESKWKIFSIFILVYFSLHKVAISFVDRDIIFLIQILLSLRWLRSEIKPPANSKAEYSQIIYPLLLGFSIPVSFLYVYDRATYFLLLFVYLLTYFSFVKGRRFVMRAGMVAFAAMLLSGFIIGGIFGFSYLPVTIQQLSYWAKYSGLFTGLAYPKINITVFDLKSWLGIFLQSCCLTILCLKFSFERSTKGTSFKSFLSQNCVEIFLLLCAVLTMRVALGRADDWYLITRGFFPIFLFATIIGRYLLQRNSLPSFPLVLTTVVLCCTFFNMNSVSAAVNIFGMVQYPSTVKAILSKTNLELLDPLYVDAATQIKNDLAGQSCFYTLTAEGVWYRIFSMKPCSKYWNLVYSTSTESQEELIRELQAEQPRIILYSNHNQFWPNGLDGITKETSHLLVHQYIWQNYRPYRMLNNNWFWIQRESDTLSNLFVANSNKVLGSFEGFQPLDSNQKLDVSAFGWSMLGKGKEDTLQQNPVFLTYSPVNLPNDLKMLGVGFVSAQRYDIATALNSVNAIYSGWNVSFNKLNIPPNDVLLRAWAYNPEDYKLYEISSDSPMLIKGELPTAKRVIP